MFLGWCRGCRWSGWLIGGACLALVSLVVGDGYLTEDGCLAMEAFGGKYDFLMHLMSF